MDDPEEEVKLRQSAYCLCLGLSPRFIAETMTERYHTLLVRVKNRVESHKERMNAFKKANGPGVRLPLDSCCEEETIMCRIIR